MNSRLWQNLLLRYSAYAIAIVLVLNLSPMIIAWLDQREIAAIEAAIGQTGSVQVMELPVRSVRINVLSEQDLNPPLIARKNTDSAMLTGRESAGSGPSLHLSELFVLDELFDNGHSDLLDRDQTTLADLLLLNALFNQGRLLDPSNQYDLAEIFVLDELFDTDVPLQLNSGYTSIKDILILDQLFR